MQKIIDHHKYHANLRNRGREKEQKKKKRKSTQSPICTSLSIYKGYRSNLNESVVQSE